MKYYLGLDNGSSSVKAALYDENGLEICACKCDVTIQIPKPGRCERDMEELWQANCKMIQTVLQNSGIPATKIRAISCCGHGKGLYLWGAEGPVYRGILSADSRAEEYVKQWKNEGIDRILFGKTKQKIMACHTVALMCWIRDHNPLLIPKIRYVFTCKDYVRYRLTGEAYGEFTESSGMGVVNTESLQYDEEIFSVLHLEEFRQFMPPIVAPTEICGFISDEAACLTGLAKGTPVAAGLFDIGAAAIALDAVESKNICMIAGTWSINEYIREKPVMDGSIRMNTVFCEKQRYLIEESSPTSTANLQWYISNVLQKCIVGESDDTLYQLINKWVKSIPAEVRCPIFLPFIYGSNVDGAAESALIGLNASHTICHITRAVFEGIVFEHRRHFERLLQSHPDIVKEIHLAGGAVNSDVWTQMFADICGYPIKIAQVKEPGALGCAIVAAIAVGDYPDLNTAISHMVKLSEPFFPEECKKRIYNKKYELYQMAVQVLKGLQEKLADYDKGGFYK